MSESNGKLSGLKGKPSPFKLPDGTEVTLRTITFNERNELLTWMNTNKDTPNWSMELERKLVALALCDESGARLCTVEEVGELDPEKVDAIGMEAGARCGLTKRTDEKKAMPPDSSMTTTSSSPATTPLPAE